ncbi:PfkB family carbohydrate kinase [Actomonas aquatica]|uniref:PfkB family carbohydrate kinase n=1 Tax=Actomonas aquatica TaxID=2866162 RepID=A0ABZ1C8V7_9BACT|nr:PfkB family carbohydrate kinase [Opitutus sp. WL0086]WRQ88024.1 PfkB family carbohydrate kinase [Opitutus sp. WL0086]
MPQPVLTFTANPLAETTLQLSAPAQLGRTQRASSRSFQVGGKGFNVAKMLHRLGGDVTALSFAGGATGEVCRLWLEEYAAFAWELLPLTTPSREGTVVRAADGSETTFLGPDCVIDGAAAQAAAARLLSADPSTTIALCGSVPGWDAPAYAPLRDCFLQQLAPERLAVDTYGPALVELVQRPLALVKINRDEFNALADTLDLPPKLPAMQRALPVQAWIVTNGGNDIEFATATTAGTLTPPSVTEVSPTGSGDVFFATVLAGDWRDDATWPDLLTRAAELAARNAAHPGIAEFELPA